MGLESKLEAEVRMKSSADSVFKMLAEEVHNVPDTLSDNVQGVELQEGDWVTTGSVKHWTYTIDGKKEVFKEKVEVDKESKTVTMVPVGGEILEKYKALKIVKHVPDGASAKVKVQIVYEKFDANHADPNNYLKFVVNVLKDSDALLVGKQE